MGLRDERTADGQFLGLCACESEVAALCWVGIDRYGGEWEMGKKYE